MGPVWMVLCVLLATPAFGKGESTVYLDTLQVVEAEVAAAEGLCPPSIAGLVGPAVDVHLSHIEADRQAAAELGDSGGDAWAAANVYELARSVHLLQVRSFPSIEEREACAAQVAELATALDTAFGELEAGLQVVVQSSFTESVVSVCSARAVDPLTPGFGRSLPAATVDEIVALADDLAAALSVEASPMARRRLVANSRSLAIGHVRAASRALEGGKAEAEIALQAWSEAQEALADEIDASLDMVESGE